MLETQLAVSEISIVSDFSQCTKSAATPTVRVGPTAEGYDDGDDRLLSPPFSAFMRWSKLTANRPRF
jgi:hypothetical protein